MARRSRSRARQQVTPFFPTQAFLGYPKDYEQDPLLKERRREYAIFARKLHAILRPLLGDRYALHEDMLVLTDKGFAGQGIEVDCVAVTPFGVFVISHFRATGEVRWGTKANEVTILGKSGTAATAPCPLRRAAPAVHFLSALLSDLQCPVQAIAIVTNDACKLELGLPTTMLKLDELHHFLRQSYARFIAVDWHFLNVRDISARLRDGCQDWEQAVTQAQRDALRH